MKKQLLILLIGSIWLCKAQPSMQLINTSNSTTITPNATVQLYTAASSNTNIIVDIKNTSSQTKSYIVIRYDITLNTGASAYFCFAGNCYGPPTIVSPVGLTLTPGQSASQLSGSYNMLYVDLDEGPTVGYSLVKYTIRNETNPSDSIQFVMRYNSPSGFTEETKIASLTMYPTLVKNIFCIQSDKYTEGLLEILDLTGKVMSSERIFLTAGRKYIKDISSLQQGIYFIRFSDKERTLFKKFIKE